jgi:oligopeptide transport system substrate-binding protein
VGAAQFLAGKTTDFSTVSVRALDARTLQITLAYRAPYFLTVVSNVTQIGMPIHPASVEKFGGLQRRDSKWSSPGNLISNGAFVLKEWRPNQFVAVVRNEHYWDKDRVRLHEIRFYPSEDDGVEERAYRTGQLHTTSRLPPNKAISYQADGGPAFQLASLLQTEFISFNCTRPPFSDPRVRRALALAIDRSRLIETIYGVRAQPAISFTRPGTGGFEPRPMNRFDAAEARRWLVEAGFPAGKGFPPVELRIAAGRSDITALAEALQQMWKHVLGIEVTVAQMEKKSLIASLFARSFQMSFSAYYYSLDDPSDVLDTVKKDSPANYAGWHDTRYETACGDVRIAATDAERLAVFARMEEILAEEAPYLPMFHVNRARLVHPTVRRWRENRLAQVDWRELWLEAPR